MALQGLKTLVREFKKDIGGNFGVMASMTILGLASVIGLSVDGQRVYTHSAKSQSVADAAGLAAAIYASNNGGNIPATATDGVFVEGQTYSAAELGFQLSKGESITFTVEYDEPNSVVNVVTVGTVEPVILQLIGKKAITTRNISTVEFNSPSALEPASLAFVLDMSGSMWFDDLPIIPSTGFPPDEAVRRIDALKTNLTTLNNMLIRLGANKTVDGNRFVRTGIIPFNTTTIGGQQTQMQFSALTQEQIDILTPGGGTDSSHSIQRAKAWMESEDQAHKARNGNEDAHKYLVIMTDGQNTDGEPETWVALDDTGLFRRWNVSGYCGRVNRNGKCTKWVDESSWEEWDVDIHGIEQGLTEPLGTGWEEGNYFSDGDAQTIAACESMKTNEGVRIFTIGFALHAGDFETNDWQYIQNGFTPASINEGDTDRALGLLSECATDDSTFLLADDEVELEEAFNKIGIEIATLITRVKS